MSDLEQGSGAGGDVLAADEVCPPPLPHERMFANPKGWVWGAAGAPEREDLAPAGWRDRKPHPWRRYLARQLDTLISGLLGFIVVEFALFAADPDLGARFLASLGKAQGVILSTSLIVMTATFGNALLLGLSGTTIGKWLFGIKVLRKKDGRPIGILRAFARELRVAVFGLGLGLPVLSLIAMIAGMVRLVGEGSTGWDEAMKLDVAQRPNGLFQIFLGLVGFVLLVGALAGLYVLGSAGGRG